MADRFITEKYMGGLMDGLTVALGDLLTPIHQRLAALESEVALLRAVGSKQRKNKEEPE